MASGRLIKELKWRGLFDHCNAQAFPPVVVKGRPTSVYAGFDPTADSLHVGNLLALVTLKRFQLSGYKPIALIGGATGRIGDPSGKNKDREALSQHEVDQNTNGIEKCISKFLDFQSSNCAEIVNNIEWYSGLNVLDFVSNIGRHFRMGQMLSRESVRSRIGSSAGMCFTEFTYQLFQAYDFVMLSQRNNCWIQIGGSDQWGNITAGIELFKKMQSEADVSDDIVRKVMIYGKHHPVGLTVPLLQTADGKKFGKSEGNAVWLDENKTTAFKFYQFFLNQPDQDAEKLLKMLTFLEEDTIEEIISNHRKFPEERLAQKRLADELTLLVHGKENQEKSFKLSGLLFGEALDDLSAKDILSFQSEIPTVTISMSYKDKYWVDLLKDACIIKSKAEARRLISSGGFYVNNQRITDAFCTIDTNRDFIEERVCLLRTGKKSFTLLLIDL